MYLPARRLRLALALSLALGATVTHAHPELEAALERLNSLIAAAPDDASLYLQRGELYARHQDWILAEANYLRAAELNPHLPRLECARGELALARQAFRDALGHFDRALADDSRDAAALVLRARTHTALGDRRAALADFEAGLRLLENPRPELFLERASLYDNPADAIRSLDAAMARIGPAHTLQMRALELEEAAGLLDDAVRRIDRIAARAERKEIWLKRRGELLLRAGREREARDTFAAALEAIAALPPWLRESPDTAQLSAELARLTRGSS